MRTQSSIEYLLLLGGVVLIILLVAGILISTAESAGEEATQPLESDNPLLPWVPKP